MGKRKVFDDPQSHMTCGTLLGWLLIGAAMWALIIYAIVAANR